MYREEEAAEDGSRGDSEVATSQASPGVTMSWKNQGRGPLQRFRGSQALLIPRAWTSVLQNCDRMHFCLKPWEVCGPLSLQPWEMDALGLQLHISHSFCPHSDCSLLHTVVMDTDEISKSVGDFSARSQTIASTVKGTCVQ